MFFIYPCHDLDEYKINKCTELSDSEVMLCLYTDTKFAAR